MILDSEDPLAVSATTAIKAGDFRSLHSLVEANPTLPTVYVGTPQEARTLLHIATDWPGNIPNVQGMIHILVLAGAEVNAPFIGPMHKETPLHWAASSNDLCAINALSDAGADLEVTGGVIADGTPLTDAVAFRQWRAARRLLELGAKPNLNTAAALGLMDHLREAVGKKSSLEDGKVSQEELDHAFWYACHGRQLEAAQLLLDNGADRHVTPSWSPEKTVLDAAQESQESDPGTGSELPAWLQSIGIANGK